MLSLPGYISMMVLYRSSIGMHLLKDSVLKVGTIPGFLKPCLLLFESVTLLGQKLDNLT